MTTYTERSGISLLTGAYDPDGDPVTVRRLNGTAYDAVDFPVTVALTEGNAIVELDGVVNLDDTGDTSGHPADGVTAANGSFTYTLWDGATESATYTATINITGGAAGDTTAPSPVSMVPVRTSTGQDGITEIALTYSEPIQLASSGNLDVWNDTLNSLIERFVIGTDEGSGAGTMNVTGDTVYVRPTSALPGLTQISLRIDANAIEDVSGNPHVLGTIGGWWEFTTATTAGGDTTPPVINLMTPADGSTGAAINSNVALTFNEAIAFGSSGTITLRNVTDATTIETFDVVTDVGAGAGQVSISGSVLTIRPTSGFANGKEVSVRLTAGAVEDSAGNSHAGVTDDTWNFTTVQSGGAASSYQFGSHTPAGQAGIAATTFTPDTNNHFVLTSGQIVVTSAGAAANLNLGPYSVTIDGSAETIDIVSNGIHVSSSTELTNAITTAKASTSVDWQIIGRPGTNVTNTYTITNARMNGTFSDANCTGYVTVARASYDYDAEASISGGSITITCDNPGDLAFLDAVTFSGCDKIIVDGPTFAWIGSTPGYDLGDGTGFANQAPWKERMVTLNANGQGLGDFVFRNCSVGGYQVGAEAPYWKSFIFTTAGAGNGSGHVVVEDCVVHGVGIAFELSNSRRTALRRNWTRRVVIDVMRIYHTNSTTTGGAPYYFEASGNVDTNAMGELSRIEGVYNPGAHRDWLQIPRQHGSADVHLSVYRNYTVADPDGTYPEAEVDTVFFSGNSQGLPNATAYDFSNVQGHAPQGLHSGGSGINVTGELYENVLVINGLNGLTISGLNVNFTRNIVIEGTNQRPVAIKTGQGLQFRFTSNPSVPVTWADNILPRHGGGGTTNVDRSTSAIILEGSASGASDAYDTNLVGPFTSGANGMAFTLDTSSPAALKADCAVKFAPRSGSSCDGKGPFG